MKRNFLLITGFILILLSGCSPARDSIQAQKDLDPQVAVPFLAYYDKSNNEVDARLCYWDLGDNKINFTGDTVYTSNVSNGLDIVRPIMWDGDKKIVLYKNSLPADKYKEESKIIENFDQSIVYGRDIEARRNLDINGKNKDYSLSLNNRDGIAKKKVAFLFKTKGDKNEDIVVGGTDIPSYIDYNNTTGLITFVFKYSFETHTNLYIARCYADNIGQIGWDEIDLSKGINSEEIYTPGPNNSALINSKYYIQSYLSIAEIDLDKKVSRKLDDVNKECRGIVKEGSYDPDCAKDILPAGVYGDILILEVPVSSEKDLEYLMCAFKSNEFLGAIHLKDDNTWNVIDSSKKVVQTIDGTEKDIIPGNLLYFPFNGAI